MKNSIAACFIAFLYCHAHAQYDWSVVPAPPTGCYSELDDYAKRMQEARAANKKLTSEKIEALHRKTEAMTEAERMKMATQHTNMTPAQIRQMQQEQADIASAAIALEENGTVLQNRYTELETQYHNEFKEKLAPIEDEMSKLPDGEGTTKGAIDQGAQLAAQYNTEYEALCSKYFTGADALFKTWLADYKQHLITYSIPHVQKSSAIHYKQYGLTPDDSWPMLDAVGNYLDHSRNIFAMRKPRAI